MLEKREVDSSFIESSVYNDANKTLTVRMHGKNYAYHGVPKAVADQLNITDSKGTFFNQFIKDKYASNKY
jgi:hypothetical protein